MVKGDEALVRVLEVLSLQIGELSEVVGKRVGVPSEIGAHDLELMTNDTSVESSMVRSARFEGYLWAREFIRKSQFLMDKTLMRLLGPCVQAWQ
ncbi:hypothetical protein Nepgr_011639 [Nepenthes gracilis]|uniref:Uncharacterized protein n=1 Tax=Nepenthes gracilis TaxID=150966 RepID=A0AAD3SEI9_NEPGR|nr:hypothetical protein Nepgr_011639 [Nepenthes gracilis]